MIKLDSYESDFWEPAGRAGRDKRFEREPYPARGAPAGVRGGRRPEPETDDTRAGKVILTFVSVLSSVLVIAGLIYATGASARSKAAYLAAGCEPSLFKSGIQCTTQQMVVSQYDAIVTPASKQLNTDAAAYNANERHSLVAAEAALSAEGATLQAFASNLAAAAYTAQNRARAITQITNAASFGSPVPLTAITFTPQMTVTVDALIRDIRALAKLTAEQARSSSLTQLRAFNGAVKAATTAAQAELEVLHEAVNTPVTAN